MQRLHRCCSVLLREQGIAPCIPPRRHRNTRVPYSKELYTMGHGIENLVAKLKDWRRIATGYDRCASMFRSAVLLAVPVISWLWSPDPQPGQGRFPLASLPGTRVNREQHLRPGLSGCPAQVIQHGAAGGKHRPEHGLGLQGDSPVLCLGAGLTP